MAKPVIMRASSELKVTLSVRTAPTATANVSPTAAVATTESLVPCNALAPLKPGVGGLPAVVGFEAAGALAEPEELLNELPPQPHNATSGSAARDARAMGDERERGCMLKT